MVSRDDYDDRPRRGKRGGDVLGMPAWGWGLLLAGVVTLVGGFVVIAMVAIGVRNSLPTNTSSLPAVESLPPPSPPPATPPPNVAATQTKPPPIPRGEFLNRIRGRTMDEVKTAVGRPDATRTQYDTPVWIYRNATVDTKSDTVDPVIEVNFDLDIKNRRWVAKNVTFP